MRVTSRIIIDRMMAISGLLQKDIATDIFRISEKNLANKIKRGTIDLFKVIEWAGNNNVDLRSLFLEKNEDYTYNAPEFTQKPKGIYSRASDRETVIGDMLANFNNKKIARECIEKLLEIDRINPGKLESLNFIIYAFLEGMRPEKKTGT
ncbi:MAG: hypothetical protein SWH54_01260 [Thermodesulfobacteriota bacterium]|nr:hypothetical protein [Thermodesulfobacteriota bacterium]